MRAHYTLQLQHCAWVKWSQECSNWLTAILYIHDCNIMLIWHWLCNHINLCITWRSHVWWTQSKKNAQNLELSVVECRKAHCCVLTIHIHVHYTQFGWLVCSLNTHTVQPWKHTYSRKHFAPRWVQHHNVRTYVPIGHGAPGHMHYILYIFYPGKDHSRHLSYGDCTTMGT